MVEGKQAARELISQLGPLPLPEEGGYFRRQYTSENEHVSGKKLCSLIYYLIDGYSFSSLHRLGSEEIWNFYRGDPAEQVLIYPDGRCEHIILGPHLERGEVLTSVVPAGVWQGTRLLDGGAYALFGCVVVPEYDPEDYTHGSADRLLRQYPEHHAIIRAYTN
ncbi:MAG: cupin domain-containing protein [Spirochaetia bacterium]|nr:cupin domain-containing protein [Spirochaetia bacterium]